MLKMIEKMFLKILMNQKENQMDIIQLLADLKAELDNLQAKLAAVQPELDKVAKDNYDKGFADGKASVSPPSSDKIYSQVEMDAALQPLKDQIASLQKQIDGMPGQIQDALKQLRSDLKIAYQAEMAKEASSQGDFSKLLEEPAPSPDPVSSGG